MSLHIEPSRKILGRLATATAALLFFGRGRLGPGSAKPAGARRGHGPRRDGP